MDELDRDDPVVRKGALLLSALVLTPDKQLEAFRKRQTARPDVDLETLKRVRGLLDAIGYALRSTKDTDWQRLEDAWETMRRVTPPEPEEAQGPAVIPGVEDAMPEPAPAPSTPEASPPPAVRPVPVASPTAPAPTAPPALAASPPVRAPSPPAAAPPSLVAEPDPLRVVGADDEVPMGTATIDPADIVAAAAALPFAGEGPAPKPIADELPPRPPGSQDETAFVMTPFKDEPLPFDDEPPSNPLHLTLEQYASLCAECSLWPQQLDPIRKRYGMESEAQHRELDIEWGRILGDGVSKRTRFSQLVAHYKQWLGSR